jgi:hypothetical protein
VREGRLKVLRDPTELTVERKPPGSFEERVRRDPAELLRLALPAAAPSGTPP